jgi:ubiquinone/menaquinone biosynthesis C-methylase UbiE
VYPATIDPQSFTAEVFSARRLPDRRHYRWVKCKKCSLYRSDPISDIDLDELYKVSTFDYSTELHGLRNSYRKIVFKTCPSPKGKSIVEIGGGNGFFLQEAQEMGFTKLIEIEPSLSAFESAHKTLKPYFIVDMLRDGLIPDNSVDIVVIFHVLDHLPDPSLVLNQIYKMLKPGGSICIAVHNVNSVSAKILKNKSPVPYATTTLNVHQLANNLALLEKQFAEREAEIAHQKAQISELQEVNTSLEILTDRGC